MFLSPEGERSLRKTQIDQRMNRKTLIRYVSPAS